MADSNPGILHEPDPQGYYCLQWAALNNRVAIITYLIDHGCTLDTADATGQTALHWAAVRGATPSAETLLRAGANLDAADSRGYTVCHVAAQYGQTYLLYHLAMKWGANTDTLDNDGRTPLHWTAYKGFSDATRLLLVMGSRPSLPDNEGCTPLHWGAIRGNSEVCTVLLQGGAVDCLGLEDATGATPSKLAIDKGHRLLGINLADYKYRKSKEASMNRGIYKIFSTLHLSPLIWGIILGMLYMLAYSVVHSPSLPPPGQSMLCAMWLTMLLAGVGLWYLYKTTTTDPGFLPKNTAGFGGGTARRRAGSTGKVPGTVDVEAGELADANSLNSPALWASRWTQLCVSCKIVRPLRAKHCSVTDRCIQCFDHYCPWVGNAIGKGNRHLFVIFLWLELGAIALSTGTAIARIHFSMVQAPEQAAGLALLWPVVFIVFDLILLISVAALSIGQLSQVMRNVTTNELSNWHRYRYLHGSLGEFSNPFDNGWKSNCREICWPETAQQAPYLIEDLEGTSKRKSSSCGGGGGGLGGLSSSSSCCNKSSSNSRHHHHHHQWSLGGSGGGVGSSEHDVLLSHDAMNKQSSGGGESNAGNTSNGGVVVNKKGLD